MTSGQNLPDLGVTFRSSLGVHPARVDDGSWICWLPGGLMNASQRDGVSKRCALSQKTRVPGHIYACRCLSGHLLVLLTFSGSSGASRIPLTLSRGFTDHWSYFLKKKGFFLVF